MAGSDVKVGLGSNTIKANAASPDDGTGSVVPYMIVGTVDANNNFLKASATNPIPTTPGNPLSTEIVLASTAGTSAQAAADIAANMVGANKIFQGTVSVSLSAAQAAAVAAAGTSRLIVSWLPGTSGTAASTVAELDINFAAAAATALTSTDQSVANMAEIAVYAGTTPGTFQVAVVETGTISSRLWSVSISGIAQ